MNEKIQKYINRFEITLSFSDMSWWIIDYENDPAHFYCNKLMCETFMLDETAIKHSVDRTCPIAGIM